MRAIFFSEFVPQIQRHIASDDTPLTYYARPGTSHQGLLPDMPILETGAASASPERFLNANINAWKRAQLKVHAPAVEIRKLTRHYSMTLNQSEGYSGECDDC